MTRGMSTDPPGFILTEHDIQRRKVFVGLDAADIEHFRPLRGLVERNVDEYVDAFFRSFERLEEAAPLFANPAVLADAKSRKREHLVASVAGDYGSGSSASASMSAVGAPRGQCRLQTEPRTECSYFLASFFNIGNS